MYAIFQKIKLDKRPLALQLFRLLFIDWTTNAQNQDLHRNMNTIIDSHDVITKLKCERKGEKI